MTSLRCAEGISLAKVEHDFGAEERARLEREASSEELNSLLVCDGENLKITPENMLLSDYVITALIEL